MGMRVIKQRLATGPPCLHQIDWGRFGFELGEWWWAATIVETIAARWPNALVLADTVAGLYAAINSAKR